MKSAVLQNNDQIAGDLFALMKRKGTNLSKLCRDNDLSYQVVYRAIHNPLITLEFIQATCGLIASDIEVVFKLNSVSLEIEISYIS
jgi:lambda repressor-like predicted transcriptional regulator